MRSNTGFSSVAMSLYKLIFKKFGTSARGFFKTEIVCVLLCTAFIVGVAVRFLTIYLSVFHTITIEQLKTYKEMRALATLQYDLLLPCKIQKAGNGFVIVYKHKPPVTWRLVPQVSRGVNGNWTPFGCEGWRLTKLEGGGDMGELELSFL